MLRRDLVLVGALSSHYLTPPELQLGPLMELTRLELQDYDRYFRACDSDEDDEDDDEQG